MIDLGALAREAGAGGETCVVTRRWLRQVLKELRAGRAAAASNGPLDTVRPVKVALDVGPTIAMLEAIAP